MEFKLNEYHRNISDEELIEDMIRVANKIDNDTLTSDQYTKLGKYSGSTVANRFNGWNKALAKAGLRINKTQNRNTNNVSVSDEELINDIILISKKLNKRSLTSSEYDEYGKHGHSYLLLRFKTWENVIKLAGLEETGFHHKVEKKDLLDNIETIWIRLGRQPTSTDIRNGESKYSLSSYIKYFGTWRKALEAFVEYINDDSNTEEDIPASDKEIEIPTTPNEPNDTHKTKRDINLRLRFKVMQRDNFKCCMCGASPATDPSVILHIDHIKPWSKGGETVIDNLQTLCSKCNLGKSDLEL